MTVLALTGGTGFVGARLIDAALAAGHQVRALARRPQPERLGVTWIAGALDDAPALDRLLAGADAAIHVAGVVNAADRAGFVAGNVEGTRAMLAAAARADVTRFVHVSSLAAREPGLSDYGWSKAEAERLVAASPLAWTIVRPPGVYGPGDLEQLELFRMARRGVVMLPPPGRLSVIAVDDLAALLLAAATGDGPRTIYEADDGTDGWTHAGFARAIGAAVGRRVLPLPLPRALLSLVARGDRLVRGAGAKLTPDRVAMYCHPDWTVDPARRPPASLWRPRVATPQGLADTARWYRANGLL
ncbi:NAD-dependent epimerase/dehydratase family protein [Sphingomonas rubra]|uniref:Nucleoside-diphosphate-sugar epimerase n=1 Tax=Sphingomonas rubra TaxID=634430 RepID=A0A1I5PLJ5_9SPHN|nr:NAD(P)H-binding protein [Sphingomonas rubra]SFP34929.1 Nucleoside-diphosphate-sugar epimerase [Sphingomonas rubra]